MKDYKLLVLWLDYFNSSFSRSQGRRIPLNSVVKSPSLDELVEATKRAGYEPQLQKAFHPKRNLALSGYVNVGKNKPKSSIIREVASALREIRAERKMGTG